MLKRGEVALERYGMGNNPQTRWTSFSTAKSMTATLTGAALHAGLARLEALADDESGAEAYVETVHRLLEVVTQAVIAYLAAQREANKVSALLQAYRENTERIVSDLRSSRTDAMSDLQQARVLARQGVGEREREGESE